MFEITGDDIARLGDADLRSLVQRLATAEIRRNGLPLSSVIAGGNQDAADGGIDVRVDCPTEIPKPDFVPSRRTGYQVKKEDMPPGAILKEMRPGGTLRDAIRDLADARGAYIIVSSQGSVADKPLKVRQEAMRDALNDLPTTSILHTDFYDRDRIANWVDEYPGVASWVRGRVGRPLSGWSAIGEWEGIGVPVKPYFFNDKVCLIDTRSREQGQLTIPDGIARIRDLLRKPRQCVRLVGLSGLGKTRLVEALFEEGVGEDFLDPSLAVYTDYSGQTTPTARDMARELIMNKRRAILVVDNCNPATHAEIARLCASDASEVSLFTVEYDVADDEPEDTDVFRLQSSSPELVAVWIAQLFPAISEMDRKKIAEFSDGNFRVARAIAATLGKGETLGSVRNSDIFERLFHQRNQADQDLLRTAEDLSLLYSIDGEDISAQGELARVGALREIGYRPLYEALAELRKRGIVQARGRYRAILPQAIANPLAARALDRIPPAVFDKFCATLPPRMLTSVSRRLGLLHDSAAAQTTVGRWLGADGPFGDLLAMDGKGPQIIRNIAPAAPEAVLAEFEIAFGSLSNHPVSQPWTQRGHEWVGMIKAIAYDPNLFDRAATLLARFAAFAPESNNIYAGRNIFCELFHFTLSGTQASPAQRRALVKRLAASPREDLQSSARIAASAMLKAGYFMSSSGADFGARSRDWGWRPKTGQETCDWFAEAITLAVEVLPDSDARTLLADNVRELWHYPPCRDALSRVATKFNEKRPWVEGWNALRTTLRYDGRQMPEDVRAELKRLIERMKPLDLLNKARAVVLNRANGDYELVDDDEEQTDAVSRIEKSERLVYEVGRDMAGEPAIRAEFFGEMLLERHAMHAFHFGRGLADGADSLDEIWTAVVDSYGLADGRKRNPTILGGFLFGAHQRDQSFASLALENAIDNPNLAPSLPYFQARAGIDEAGIARLRRAISKGVLAANNFGDIANGSVKDSPPELLSDLLDDIAALSGGIEMALKILAMYFTCHEKNLSAIHPRLVSIGRNLLSRATFHRESRLHDFAAQTVIRGSLKGEDGEQLATKVCANILSALNGFTVSSYDLKHVFDALFSTQPIVALDTFLLSPSPSGGFRFGADREIGEIIENVEPKVLKEWANRDRAVRYLLLGKRLNMFREKTREQGSEVSALFLSMLAEAPDQQLFLGDFKDRVSPQDYGPSFAAALISLRALLVKLMEQEGEQVAAWVSHNLPQLDRWIEDTRGGERRAEESFE